MSDPNQTHPAAENVKKPKAAKAAAEGVRIISRKDGLRRAGIAHTGDVTHPAGAFTAAQLKLLRAEPLLTVIDSAGEADAS
jgi:hypothetical protein